MKIAWSVMMGVLAAGLIGSASAARNTDYTDFAGGYSGRLKTVSSGGDSGSGPAIALVVPSRNGSSVRINIQGNFILVGDQYAYNSEFRVNSRGQVRTTNFLLFYNENAPSLGVSGSGRARLSGRRLRIRIVKVVGGDRFVATHALKFSRRSLAVQTKIAAGGVTAATVRGGLRKRL